MPFRCPIPPRHDAALVGAEASVRPAVLALPEIPGANAVLPGQLAELAPVLLALARPFLERQLLEGDFSPRSQEGLQVGESQLRLSVREAVRRHPGVIQRARPPSRR